MARFTKKTYRSRKRMRPRRNTRGKRGVRRNARAITKLAKRSLRRVTYEIEAQTNLVQGYAGFSMMNPSAWTPIFLGGSQSDTKQQFYGSSARIMTNLTVANSGATSVSPIKYMMCIVSLKSATAQETLSRTSNLGTLHKACKG
jgi:hypothetical protein